MKNVILENISLPEALTKLKPGSVSAVTGVSESLGAVLAAGAAVSGQKVLIVTANDLKATKAADDLRQLLSTGVSCLPGGEIDLTRSAGSLESSWRRLEALAQIMEGSVSVLSTSVDAMVQRMGSPSFFRESCFTVSTGDRISLQNLTNRLTHIGYERVSMVEGKGQFALRGSILDIYPPDIANAVRIEFFDDEVDGLRTFDCISQRSLEKLDRLTLFPASEVLLQPDEYPTAAKKMRQALNSGSSTVSIHSGSLFDDLPPLPDDDEDGAAVFDALVAPKVQARSYADAMSSEAERRISRLMSDADLLEEGIPFRRIRSWLPVLTENTSTVSDWFKPDLILLFEPDKLRTRADERIQGFAADLESAISRSEAVQAQELLLLNWQQILDDSRKYSICLFCSMLLSLGGIRPETVEDLKSTGIPEYGSRIKALGSDCRVWHEKGYRILLLSGGNARGHRLSDTLTELGLETEYREDFSLADDPDVISILPMTLSHGFVLPESALVVVSDADIWGEGFRKSKSKKNTGERISTFTDLKINDYVVHEDHGVGIYKGITRIQSSGTWRDYLLIQYGGNDKLYVPVEQLERVQRYIGNPDQPPRLNKLGGGEWSKQKNKVREGLKAMAFDLKKLYAERTQRVGFAFSPDTAWQREFEDEFPYELTPDQQRSVKEIAEDMESDRTMDRLLCGDVGYGKTEVSLRAAFKAIADNKQVALLAPTTILVQQHYNTIVKRFRNTGARIEFLSRFRTAKEQREVLSRLAAGDVDIIVGTHRLLAKDVVFRDLGLLIVDEEQRFGVTHKEKIKNLKNRIDVLTLSATPIPRTLHMSMVGIRDMSLLETPPEERLPVQTQVIEYSDAIVRDAILREISRGGQIYFLYNRVRSIARFYERLHALVPEARIGVAHGQMKENALEDVMMDFYAGSYDLLLCTTIIESGLDVPSANTLIVYDADRFGLSQLYQLRGRVGRSNRQAYAYFTVRPDQMLSETATQRLSAIREFTEFGSGFRIAMRDLEIRGAGNILGLEQHGHLETVGYDMYCKLMEETLGEVQGTTILRELETRVDLPVDAYLPTDYVQEEKQRMEMYKRIASIVTPDDREDITDEMLDRYGDLPPVVDALLDVSQLRSIANRLGVSRVCMAKGGLLLQLDERHIPDPGLLLQATQDTDHRLTFTAGKPAGILLRDGNLRSADYLPLILKLSIRLLDRLEKLREECQESEKTL